MEKEIKIYTDGSCHTQLLIGAWVALIFWDDDKLVLQGTEKETSHNRMELLAVINALDHLAESGLNQQKIKLYSDSQYVVKLPERLKKMEQNAFLTQAGNEIRNADLVKKFGETIRHQNVEFVKVKAHQKNGDVLNREADLLVRRLLRDKVRS